MKSKKYYNKEINITKLERYQHIFLPDDYDEPCYRIFFEDKNGYGSDRGEGCYYVELHLSENNEIIFIERYHDNFFCNYLRKTMSPSAEKEAEKCLDFITD